MRAIHFLIGLVFDALILVAAGGLVYAVFQPELLTLCHDALKEQLSTSAGQYRLLGIGAVFFLLAFRSLFLLLFRGAPASVVVADRPGGRVTLSQAAIESVLRRLVEMSNPDASLRRASAFYTTEGVDIEVRVDLDLVDITLAQYAAQIETLVRNHFKDKLGVTVKQFHLQAGDRASGNSLA